MKKTAMMTTVIAALLAWPAGASGQIGPEAAQGAQVWASNCTRCHNARPSAERTDVEWMVIVNHMRARANLTKSQARMVTAFLQATNLPPRIEAAPGPAATVPTAAPVAPTPAVEGPPETAATPGGTFVIDARMLENLTVYLARLMATSPPPAG